MRSGYIDLYWFFKQLIRAYRYDFHVIFLLYHLASMETFGVPYMIPFVASEGRDLEDSIYECRCRILNTVRLCWKQGIKTSEVGDNG